jgi:carbamoyl-phosphate synthase large subunit
MGGAGSFGMAFVKAMLGAGQRLPEQGAVCITVNNEDKGEVLPIAQGLADLGFQIIGTRGTAAYLRAHGVACSVVFKVNEGRRAWPRIVNRKISMLINAARAWSFLTTGGPPRGNDGSCNHDDAGVPPALSSDSR